MGALWTAGCRDCLLSGTAASGPVPVLPLGAACLGLGNATRPSPASPTSSPSLLRSCMLRQQQRLHLISSGVATVVAALPPQEAAELQAARTFLSLF